MKEEELRAFISERLHNLLDERKWRPYKLIQESRASKNSVYNAYYGRKGVEVYTLVKICEALDVTLTEFMKSHESDVQPLSKTDQEDLKRLRMLDEVSRQKASAYIEGLVEGRKE